MANTLAETASTITQIKEISNRAQDRIGTVRNIAQRLQALRERLIGSGVVEMAKEAATPSEPARPEVDDLSHNLNVLGVILNEIQEDLSALEGL